MIILPTRTDLARYSFEITLSDFRGKDKNYVFDFDWNDRSASWFMSISLPDGTLLLSGRQVVVGFPLTSRFRDEQLPGGLIMAIDTSGAGLEAGFADLGDRVVLAFTPVSELPDSLKKVV